MNFEDRYGLLDRLLYRVVFRAGIAQRTMADVEDALYGDVLQSVPLQDPVFIAALPRCGTTILLKLLVGTDRFASHTYRDTPFVLAPMLWQRFSSRFTINDEPKERAHGDGLHVSANSPEAFEEMIWKHFWPAHYEEDRIRPWKSGDRNGEFEDFLETHMRKIITLRRNGPDDDRRYISKNNLNVSRLAAPPAPLRKGIFLLPFREPIQHAASMLEQHRRFLRLHDENDFVREYMEAIGHHEFGEGLKPVDFGGWLEDVPDPEGLEFWLRYWVAAYRFVLEHADASTVLISYGRLTGEAEEALARLADAVDLDDRRLRAQADRLRPPRDHDVRTSSIDALLLEEAKGLHQRLRRKALV